jgi:hypothetical protein
MINRIEGIKRMSKTTFKSIGAVLTGFIAQGGIYRNTGIRSHLSSLRCHVPGWAEN